MEVAGHVGTAFSPAGRPVPDGRAGGDRPIMPTYVTLYNWTEQGITNIGDSPERLDEARGLMETLGGELHGFYMTMGEYDLVTVSEFPDDDAVAKFMLRLGGAGNARTTTMKAWPEAAYREIVADLP